MPRIVPRRFIILYDAEHSMNEVENKDGGCVGGGRSGKRGRRQQVYIHGYAGEVAAERSRISVAPP